MFNHLPYSHKVGFSYEYYVLDKIREDYDKVWHWKDFPEKLMYENNLIDDYEIFSKYRYDIGADLVALKNNKYYFIQCKNFKDTILMESLAGFYFLLHEYNLTGILYYNGTLSQRVKDLSRNKIQFINLPFNNSTLEIVKNIDKPIMTRVYQFDACTKLINKQQSILSLPCGMGKTYTASLLASNYDNIIILSPLRYLAVQNLECYKKYIGIDYSPIMISIDGTRKIGDINNYIQNKNIISSTYDSVDIVIQLLDRLQNIYIIIDEFHNLSENNIKNKDNDMYKIINYNCDKIFLSATPIKNFMNITDIYNYSWSDAIKNKYICDFTIYIPDKNEDYQSFVELIKKTCNELIDEKIIKKAYFMLKSMLFNGDKKCICYMTCIEFANNMYNVLIWLSKLLNVEIEYWLIDYNTKKTIRERCIDNFKKSLKIAILINVHILDEGINIPECDSVFITQPSNNMINIIQRMCRANRIIDNKLNCNIYLWCKEKKADFILSHIYNNTSGFIKDKVYIHNTKAKHIKKHNILETDNMIDYDVKSDTDNNNVSNNNKPVIIETNMDSMVVDNKDIHKNKNKVSKSNDCMKKNNSPFYCNKCDFTFKNKYNIEKHFENGTCILRQNYALNKTCKYCSIKFSSTQACNNHMNGRCKKKLNMETSNKQELIDNNNIIQKISNNNKIRKALVEKLNYFDDGNNKHNDIPNNILTINPVDKPNIFLDNETIKKILSKGINSIPELITQLYFTKEHPENHNVYIGNKKDFRLSYFNGDRWMLSNDNNILDILYNKYYEFLLCKFDELKDELDEPTLLTFREYKNNINKTNIIKNNKNDIQFIMYNLKDIILDTKKKNN
jgi:superfamily II DNA or RNA helicase